MADAAHEQEAVGGGRGGDQAAHLVLGLGLGLGLVRGIGLGIGLGVGVVATRPLTLCAIAASLITCAGNIPAVLATAQP